MPDSNLQMGAGVELPAAAGVLDYAPQTQPPGFLRVAGAVVSAFVAIIFCFAVCGNIMFCFMVFFTIAFSLSREVGAVLLISMGAVGLFVSVWSAVWVFKVIVDGPAFPAPGHSES